MDVDSAVRCPLAFFFLEFLAVNSVVGFSLSFDGCSVAVDLAFLLALLLAVGDIVNPGAQATSEQRSPSNVKL